MRPSALGVHPSCKLEVLLADPLDFPQRIAGGMVPGTDLQESLPVRSIPLTSETLKDRLGLILSHLIFAPQRAGRSRRAEAMKASNPPTRKARIGSKQKTKRYGHHARMSKTKSSHRAHTRRSLVFLIAIILRDPRSNLSSPSPSRTHQQRAGRRPLRFPCSSRPSRTVWHAGTSSSRR